MAGVVSAVGDGVAGVAVGDRVTADACWRCGTCAFCRRGDYHICVRGGALGLHSDGALAPYVQIPAYMAVQIPEGLDDRFAALAEPAAVGFHAADRAEAASGLPVVVIGFGVIGTFAALAARISGAHVMVVEPDTGRRELARSLGFDRVIDARAPSIAAEVRGLTDGLGAESAIDCTGQPDAVVSALRLVRRGGSVVVAGIALEPTTIDLKQVVLFERRILGSLGYRNDIPRVLGLMSDGTLDVTRFALDEIDLEHTVTHGLDVLARRDGERFKILVLC
jgi:(R,R)-butanediol dehydrogenase / meso-butanediol dehydrogenase / diacetyl reductase